jgi:hypothetical protein
MPEVTAAQPAILAIDLELISSARGPIFRVRPARDNVRLILWQAEVSAGSKLSYGSLVGRKDGGAGAGLA